jgi:glyoxylase-like metal-dependent hydrolase (beta-lactamase superfamily II)/8-oxo-dGTP pyrophosphatase MutT (NUDIX family)
MSDPGLGAFGHVVPRAAATVVLLRPGRDGPEVLLAHRPPSMAFAPDVHVFPGGAVDEDDHAPVFAARSRRTALEAAERLGGTLSADQALAHHVAAIRELLEEAGVLLAGFPGDDRPLTDPDAVAGLRARLHAGGSFGAIVVQAGLGLRTDLLMPLSRWVTPPVLPRRFDARFFAAWLPDGAEPSLVGDEVVAHGWVRPTDALRGLADGSIPMWLPTSANLQRLEAIRGPADLLELAPGRAGVPAVAEVAPDVVAVTMPGAAGVDGLEVRTYLIGGRELVAVDPGDPSEESLLALVEATASSGATIGAVALTAPDPDHAGGAESLRDGLGVLVHGAQGAGRSLPFPVEWLPEAAVVPSGDVHVVAVPAPGPDPAHLVLWIPASATAIVGDLVGPAPARTVRGPHDPVAWRRSLDRLRALGPRRLLPAHGEPVEGSAAVERAIAAVEVRLPVV